MEAGLSLGSNLGDRLGRLREAVRRLAAVDGVRLVASSPVYETAPVGARPPYRDLLYLNAVVVVETTLTLEALSREVHAVEDAMGRRRSADRNAPRPIDIDVLYAGDERRDGPDLTVPHPRWAERRFVAQPLADVRPALVPPGAGRTVAEVLAHLPGAEPIRRFADPLC
jgi:2-amino-4-hydroxy-6-hydroxymethyldihydropteridine diphosphokinase